MDDPPLTLTVTVAGGGEGTLTFGTLFPVIPGIGLTGWAGSMTFCGRDVPIYLICGYFWLDLPPECGSIPVGITSPDPLVCPPFLVTFSTEINWNCGGGCNSPLTLHVTVTA